MNTIELPGGGPNLPSAIGDRSDKAQQAIRDFLTLSRKQFKTSESSTSKLREKMRRDQRFASSGDQQWDPADLMARTSEGRPALSINRIPQFLRQVSNQIRANRSQIQIHPRGGDASNQLAAAFQAVIRGIEVDSDADVAYDTGCDHQLRSGLGFVWLKNAYRDDDMFDQVCVIDRVRNPLSVYWDPSTQRADFGDMRWLHILGVMGRDEYEDKYGTFGTYQSLTEFMKGDGAVGDDWMPEGKVIVVEYYYVTREMRELLQLANGHTVWADELDRLGQAYQQAGQQLPPIARYRKSMKHVVRYALHNAVQILEGNDDLTAGMELPGTRIPVFPVMGEEIDIDGTVDYKGMVRDAIDPQKMYNFWASSIAEVVALTPKAPYIAVAAQIDQYMDDWKDANRVAHAVLYYDPVSVDGALVPPPQRNIAEAPIQGMVIGLKEADNDLKAVMGLYDASLGDQGPEESGKAIEARQRQGQVANSNFLDNLQRTKRALGRTLLKWIPVIYDTPRLEHLVKPDGTKSRAIVYAGQDNKPQQGEFPPEIVEMYDMGVGHFDVSVSTGPSYETQKLQTESWLLELFKVLPGLAEIGADIVLENSEQPAAQQLAKRVKASLPPQFQDQDDPAMELPRLTSENAQLKQLLEKANSAVQAMAETISMKKLEIDGKVQVAFIQAHAQLSKIAAELGSETNRAVFDAEYNRFSGAIDHLNQMMVSSAQHDQALEQQAAGAASEAAITKQKIDAAPKPGAKKKPTA